MNIPDTALGAIAAAIIGAVMVLITTILSKEQKTSEFRQTWVDALRNDLAEYVGGVGEFAAYVTDQAGNKNLNADDFVEKNYARIEKLEGIRIRILLRLNPKEHKALIASISNFLDDTVEEIKRKEGKNDYTSEKKEAIIAESQRILKEEWKRVKKGELAFRAVKYISMTSVAIGLVVLGTYFWPSDIF